MDNIGGKKMSKNCQENLVIFLLSQNVLLGIRFRCLRPEVTTSAEGKDDDFRTKSND